VSDQAVIDKGSNISIGQCQAAANTAEAAAAIAAQAETSINDAVEAIQISEENAKASEVAVEIAKKITVSAQETAVEASIAASTAAMTIKGTSSSTVVIGSGSKSFTTQAGKQFGEGQYVVIADYSDPITYWMYGIVTAYIDEVLTVEVLEINGAGNTKSNWVISVAGVVGKTPAITIGTTTTLSAGSQAIVTLAGTAENPVLNFGIPEGSKGDENYTNIDGGTPFSIYGGITPIDLGGVS